MEPRRKQRKTGALKTSHVQPKKKQRTTMMISVPSRSDSGFIKAADRQDSIKAKLPRCGGLISKPAGGIEKINNAQENSRPKSSFSCGDELGDLARSENKIQVFDDEQVVKKALQAAMQTSRYAQIRRSRELMTKEGREKQREAARIALDMMEKTVEFEDNLMVLKEFEMLIGST